MYRVLANVVAVTHGLLVIAVTVGSLASFVGWFRNRTGPTVLFVLLLASLVVSDRFLGECALTGLEQRLRNLDAPGSAYSGSFIGRYFAFVPDWVHAWLGPMLVIGSLIAIPAWQIQAHRAASAGPMSGASTPGKR
jgi:hypothetical protein